MQKEITRQKCAIIGCGFVGSTTAYSLMQSGMFSEMVLIDINQKKAEGEANDLNHGLPFLSPMDIYAGNYSDISDAFLIIITAGANQKPGQTRIELVNDNIKVFRSIVGEITKHNSDGIILVVTNPVDILTYVTLVLSGFPSNRVIGSGTVLDTARLKYLVGRQIGVDSRNVHSFIIGEHGDSELPVWSSANVSGIDLQHFSSSVLDMTTLEKLYEDVKNSAYKIIEAKGATYYAIAESVKRIVAAIVRDENAILPLSIMPNGEYGLNELCIGLPCIVGKNGIKEILEIPLNNEEYHRLQRSAKSLSEILEQTGFKKSEITI